ncbi:MAG: D-alanyl-D-alanine carboxypeptidase DacF, partial [Alphaproteobacteria bacterium MarineAlpha5_Bin11]
MYKIIYVYLVIFLLFFPTGLIAKRAAIIIDYETNETLFEVNADTLNYPASLVKMMTLYLTFEALEEGRLNWDQKLKVSEVASSRSPSKLYLEPGSTIEVGDAVNALIIKSANDVATVISESLAKTEREFAKKMTKKAKL